MAVSLLRPLREAEACGLRWMISGMGYAGLRQLQHMKSLPVDIPENDKAFIDMLPEDTSMWFRRLSNWHAAAICASWRKGVEKEAQYHWLQAAGVDVVQGFLFGCALSQGGLYDAVLARQNEGVQVCNAGGELGCVSAQSF